MTTEGRREADRFWSGVLGRGSEAVPEVKEPSHEIAAKWVGRRKNILLLRKDIDALRGTYSLEDVDDAIVEYEDISREDYESMEEYQDEKDGAWENIIDAIESAERLEEEVSYDH